jgi:hypothetical protein
VVFTPKYVDLAIKLTNKNHKISLKTRITRRQFLKPTLYQPRGDRFKSKEDMDSLWLDDIIRLKIAAHWLN